MPRSAHPNAGPWTPIWDRTVRKEESEIFCYLGPRSNVQGIVLKALMEVAQRGIPVRAHVPRLSDEAMLLLDDSGIVTERNPISFTGIQRRTRLALSLGSLSFVSCAFAAGIPQIVFRSSIAQKTAADAIHFFGVGRSLQLNVASPLEPALLAQALEKAFRDETFAIRAKPVAPDFERRLEPRPEFVVAQLVEELV